MRKNTFEKNQLEEMRFEQITEFELRVLGPVRTCNLITAYCQGIIKIFNKSL